MNWPGLNLRQQGVLSNADFGHHFGCAGHVHRLGGLRRGGGHHRPVPRGGTVVAPPDPQSLAERLYPGGRPGHPHRFLSLCGHHAARDGPQERRPQHRPAGGAHRLGHPGADHRALHDPPPETRDRLG